jgi:ferredoxin, 2Fe-2S
MMNRRAFTVGSLIPGSVLPKLSTTVLIKKESSPIPATKIQIVVMQNKQSFEIQPEKGKLLDVALSQGKPIEYKCRKGTCGQCTVKVIEGVGLTNPNSQEQKKLGKEIANGYRLACQAEII